MDFGSNYNHLFYRPLYCQTWNGNIFLTVANYLRNIAAIPPPQDAKIVFAAALEQRQMYNTLLLVKALLFNGGGLNV